MAIIQQSHTTANDSVYHYTTLITTTREPPLHKINTRALIDLLSSAKLSKIALASLPYSAQEPHALHTHIHHTQSTMSTATAQVYTTDSLNTNTPIQDSFTQHYDLDNPLAALQDYARNMHRHTQTQMDRACHSQRRRGGSSRASSTAAPIPGLPNESSEASSSDASSMNGTAVNGYQ